MIHIQASGYVCAIRYPYNPVFTDAIKALPAWTRGWNRDKQQWEIAPLVAPRIIDQLSALSGQSLAAPPADAYHPPVSVTVEALYVGRIKGDGDFAAANVMTLSRQWRAVLWGPAVYRWFGVQPASATPASLYDLIGVSPTASAAELANAIKRQLRQWHPDVCREPDAAERTRRILEARAILLAPAQRARYDAGLEAARLAAGRAASRSDGEYRPPLRSGRITGQGYKIVDRWVVADIRHWDDLTDDQGRVAVVSWPHGADEPVVLWV